MAVVAEIGRGNVFYGLADEYYDLRHPFYWKFPGVKWDWGYMVRWNHTDLNYLSCPSSKVARSFYDEFPELRIDLDLWRYKMVPQPEAEALAGRWLQEKIEGPFAFCHFFSEVSSEDKMLTPDEAMIVCDTLLDRGLTPVILDNPRRQPRRPDCLYLDTTTGLYDRWGNAQVLRSLIARAALAIGIDSGPMHVTGATETPSLVIWKRTVCPYCFDPAPNVLHLTPDYMPGLMFPDFKDEALEAFTRDYRSQSYDNLSDCLPTALNTLIDNSFAKGNIYVS